MGDDLAGGADRVIGSVDGSLYQAVTGGDTLSENSGVLMGMWMLLAGASWAAQDCCDQQQVGTDAKENAAILYKTREKLRPRGYLAVLAYTFTSDGSRRFPNQNSTVPIMGGK